MEKIEKLGSDQTRGDSLWDKAGIISCYTPACYNADPTVKYFPLRWPGTFQTLPKRNEGASHEMDEWAVGGWGGSGSGIMYKPAFVHCCCVGRDGDKVLLCAGQMSCLGISVYTFCQQRWL